jgi:hypothetical protein
MPMKACCTSLELQHAANYLVKLLNGGNRERGIHHSGAGHLTLSGGRHSTTRMQSINSWINL